MANFQTEVQTSSFNAASKIYSQTRDREGTRESVSNTAGFSSYKLVGINAAKVPEMRRAIDTYTKNIETYLNGLNPTADASNAFKGEEIVTAVQNYIDKVKNYCINLTSRLNSFSDKLLDIEQAWQSYQTTLASNINSANNAINEGVKYTSR